ncbi:MAG: flagellar export protein FliJ [Deltaproteobacteria bacterium]|nr:flagellar export protein FliJ [Deltaproteobacteria bacterium]
MNFKFRYSALLSYRKRLKEIAEIELSRAQLDLKRDNERLSFLRKEMEEAQCDLERGLKERLLSGILNSFSEYTGAMKIKIIRQEQKIIDSEKMVEKKLKNVLEKTKQCKILEKLREKDLKKWKYCQHLTEEKEMGESAIIRYGKEYLQN